MMRTLIIACSLAVLGAAVGGHSPEELCRIVVPVMDSKGETLEAAAPDGQEYPVFQMAPDSALVRRVRQALASTFACQVLRLDRLARNFVQWDLAREGKGAEEPTERLTGPMVLLLSNEQGGFARFGFWLQDDNGGRRLLKVSYVDQVVDDASLDRGDFEETFCHELSHVIMETLFSNIVGGPARKMHMSMVATDYAIAFYEGHAEHVQPMVRDATQNSYVRQLMGGSKPADLRIHWLSSIDEQLRTDGVKRNLYIYRKTLPALAIEPNPDRYQLYLDSETSTTFLIDRFKNGQEMMTCEGVIATLFYRIVNNDQLRDHTLDRSFYIPFVGQQTGDFEPSELFTPYENINLKLFATLREMNRRPPDGRRPLLIELVQTYSRLFPTETETINDIFLRTTYGATVSQAAVKTFQELASAGRIGNISEFRKLLPEARDLQASLLRDVMGGRVSLRANLGPELWILNSDFRIAQAVWSRERTVPFRINLNTATEADLMTINGVDLTLARRIISARDARGFFNTLDDLGEIQGMPKGLMKSLKTMSDRLKQVDESTLPSTSAGRYLHKDPLASCHHGS